MTSRIHLVAANPPRCRNRDRRTIKEVLSSTPTSELKEDPYLDSIGLAN
jgi:hypothetical protein